MAKVRAKKNDKGKIDDNAGQVTTVMALKKECKHSIVFETDDDDFPIRSVYVARGFAEGLDEISLTISR